jgi:hypothetical protein
MALAAFALGTAVGLAPLALSRARDPFDDGASYVFWLVGGLVSAAVVASLDPYHSVRYGIALALGFPIGFLLLVALTPMALPNLVPARPDPVISIARLSSFRAPERPAAPATRAADIRTALPRPS